MGPLARWLGSVSMTRFHDQLLTRSAWAAPDVAQGARALVDDVPAAHHPDAARARLGVRCTLQPEEPEEDHRA